MHRFDYCAPASLPETLALLDRYGKSARLIAGGTDLLTALKERWEHPEMVISLGRLDELHFIEYDEILGLRIGAGATIREVETSPLIRTRYPVLAGAAATLASIQIRNLATVAGNICRASPSADMPPALLALDASIKIAGSAGERLVPLSEAFLGPGRTVVCPNEVLTEIRVPPARPHSGAAYIKHSPRRAMDLAAIGLAAFLGLEGGRCVTVGIAMGAVAATPRRARAAEAILLGQPPTPERLAQAGETAAAESSPIDDVRGSAIYRRKMVRVLTERALLAALDMAQVNEA
ncbi:MAG TPA: xanthine dehydrogenase family protein subunit M [Anaerolineae bacterium]